MLKNEIEIKISKILKNKRMSEGAPADYRF